MPQHEDDFTPSLLVNTSELAHDNFPEISEQNRRTAKIIQNFLNYMPKLGAKLPKSILAVGLFSAWFIPTLFDLNLEQGAGTVLMQIFNKANINNIFQSLLLGAGCFTIYNSSQLYKESELASSQDHQHRSVLSIKQPPSAVMQNLREQNTFLKAKLIVVKQERAELRQELKEKNAMLTAVLRQTTSRDSVSYEHAPKVTVLRSFTGQLKEASETMDSVSAESDTDVLAAAASVSIA